MKKKKPTSRRLNLKIGKLVSKEIGFAYEFAE